MSLVTRFAPSPNGFLHLGHAYSALMGWAAAREGGGAFMLRIDDLDPERSRPQFVDAIFEDLGWLGLTWHRDIRTQSRHLAEYALALRRLRGLDVLYPCFCSRAGIRRELAALAQAPQGPDGPLYPGTCRRLSAAERSARLDSGTPHAWRLDAHRAAARTGPLHWLDLTAGRQQAAPTLLGDVILSGRIIAGSYHLAVVLDDQAQGVTRVNRGVDLFPSTHVHRLLQALLELPTPDYDHHSLLRDTAGVRLAKRADSVPIRHYRDQGLTPTDVWARTGADRGLWPPTG